MNTIYILTNPILKNNITYIGSCNQDYDIDKVVNEFYKKTCIPTPFKIEYTLVNHYIDESEIFNFLEHKLIPRCTNSNYFLENVSKIIDLLEDYFSIRFVCHKKDEELDNMYDIPVNYLPYIVNNQAYKPPIYNDKYDLWIRNSDFVDF